MIIIVRSKVQNADAAVTVSADKAKVYIVESPKLSFVIKNNGPATADVSFITGQDKGYYNINDSKPAVFTLTPGASKVISYHVRPQKAGFSGYWAGIATVTNTTDPNLSNNRARIKLSWEAISNTPPPVGGATADEINGKASLRQ